jgi:hypothetical protein
MASTWSGRFPELLEDHVGLPVVNLGAINAGIDVFSCDETVLSACSGARAVVLQAMGAHNLRNRFYSVHQRRNDRFLRASPLLSTLYPEVDFTEFAFTRHLIQTLHDTDPGGFVDPEGGAAGGVARPDERLPRRRARAGRPPLDGRAAAGRAERSPQAVRPALRQATS